MNTTLPNLGVVGRPTDRPTARVDLARVLTSVDAHPTPADVLPLEEFQ
jgi:hypothetical protein